MFLNKNKKGYGWYSQVESKDMGGNVSKGYLNFQFKKDCEPKQEELNQWGSYEGELWFKDNNGRFRKVFPIAQTYEGKTSVKLMLLDWQFTTDEVKKEKPINPQGEEDTSMFGGEKSKSGEYVDIKSEDLPFY